MNELQKALISDSAAAPPKHILEQLADSTALATVVGAPHSIYQELWHITFWQQITIDWIRGVETPFPVDAAAGFPGADVVAAESWSELCARFFRGLEQAEEAAGDGARHEKVVRCPSRPGQPVREMTVREQLESLAAHNAYHFGRIVLLRQLSGAWPPPSGGFSWGAV